MVGAVLVAVAMEEVFTVRDLLKLLVSWVVKEDESVSVLDSVKENGDVDVAVLVGRWVFWGGPGVTSIGGVGMAELIAGTEVGATLLRGVGGCVDGGAGVEGSIVVVAAVDEENAIGGGGGMSVDRGAAAVVDWTEGLMLLGCCCCCPSAEVSMMGTVVVGLFVVVALR